MKDKTDKKKLALLEDQQKTDRERQNAALAVAAKPTELETQQEKDSLDWINTTEGKNGPLDVTNLKQLKPYLSLYDNASQRQQGERMGTGLLQMGAQGSNPNLTALLKEQSQNQRQQNAAGGLENAFRLTDAQQRGNIMPLLGLQQNRTMGLAGMTSNQSQNSTNAYTNFRPAPSFWSNLLMAGVGAAGQVGAAYATGGMSAAGKH